MPNTTMIYVTHDQVEAMTLADRIVVLNAGLVEQVGSPMQLYLHPDNLFVARFIGSPAMNTVPCTIESGGATPTVEPGRRQRRCGRGRHPRERQGQEGHIRRAARGPRARRRAGPRSSPATVEIVEKLGEVTLIYVDCGDADEPVLAKLDGIVAINKGEPVKLAAPTDALHVFDADGRAYRRRGD